MNFKSLKDLGEAMQHWHSSMADPVYAIGSYYFAGMQYPDTSVLVRARDVLQGDLDNPHPSWSMDDLTELRKIIEDLNSRLDK